MTCTHQGQILIPMPQDADKAGALCPACVAMGSRWVHLRLCLTCGVIGCCDSSPNRHATAHALQSTHPIITSMERGEGWIYCYPDDVFL